MKFIQHYVLPSVVREKTHIFNSFFMEKLTKESIRQYPSSHASDLVFMEEEVPKLDIQFKQMRRWTKNVNLFDGKIEYILLPICENSHWLLAIVCQPSKVAEIIESHIKRCLDNELQTQIVPQANQKPERLEDLPEVAKNNQPLTDQSDSEQDFLFEAYEEASDLKGSEKLSSSKPPSDHEIQLRNLDVDSEKDHKESFADPIEHKESGPHVYDSAMISHARSEQLKYHAESETSFQMEDDYHQVI